MYTKKVLSASAAVAILSTGAIAFDMALNEDSNSAVSIVTDVMDYPNYTKASYVFDDNKNITASKPLKLSENDKGDALIYPAFKSGDGWETTITVRNATRAAVIAKAVLYDAKYSQELKDFNIYLSAHDVARFKIKENIVTTRDGSIMAGINPTLEDDDHVFVPHENPDALKSVIDNVRIDGDGDFVISEFSDKEVNEGYVIIYVMAQTEELEGNETEDIVNDPFSSDRYHNTGEDNDGHDRLYADYLTALDDCRGADWRKVFKLEGGTAVNGTATEINITAPNVKEDCDSVYFTSPQKDILFGEVSIAKYEDGDPRSLLLKAKALDNYTDEGQMMLWAPGEYAAIQDRRITLDGNGDGYADYNTSGIFEDSKDMNVSSTHFTFTKKDKKLDRATLLITQPMKRALVMAGYGDKYWVNIDPETKNWGEFSLNMYFYDENENVPFAPEEGRILVTVTSPTNSTPPEEKERYRNEMAVLPYYVLARDIVDEKFTGGEEDTGKYPVVNGYADVLVNPDKGLPAIITEMTSEDIKGEAQINWIYSSVEK